MEELLNIEESLKRKGGPKELVDDKGEPMVYDEEKLLLIPELILDKKGTACAVIPLGYFSNETIGLIEKIVG